MGNYTLVRQLTREKLKLGASTYIIVALLVFFATGSATVYYWYSQNLSAKQGINTAFESEIRASENMITQRMQSYEDILRGSVGLLNTSSSVTRDEWKVFIGGYDISQRYPGVQGFGYIERVPKQVLAEHKNRIQSEGYANYEVHPSGDREEYYPIVYLEPQLDNYSGIIGYDSYSESTRQAAIS